MIRQFPMINTSVALALLEGNIDASMGLGDVLAMIENMDTVLGLQLLTLSRTDLRIRPKAATITEEESKPPSPAARKRARRRTSQPPTNPRRITAAGVEVMDGDPPRAGTGGWTIKSPSLFGRGVSGRIVLPAHS